jgi:chromosome segregation ATPase
MTPDWLSKIFGRFDSVEAKLSEVTSLKAKLAETEESRVAADLALTTAQSEIADLKRQLSSQTEATEKAQKEVNDLGAKLATAEKRATETLAAQGIAQSDLPSGSAGEPKGADQIDALLKQLNASTDPKEKYTICKQIRELQKN